MLLLSESKLIDLFQERPQRLAWFLGAGASRNAGLPTATDLIWDLKRKYYQKAENQEIAPQDMQSEAVRVKVQAFMDAQGFPPLWADEEYSLYFEKIFGDDRERQRRYLIKQLSDDQVSLSLGNRIMGALVSGGYSRVAFTTNFDTVVEKAVAQIGGQAIAAYHLEGPHAARRALDNEEFPFYCKLHGDFRYDSIKNLTEDLATQNAELGASLVNAGNRFGFVVAGYSGRDKSVMQLFHDVLASPNPFPHGLFWTGISRNPVAAVSELLDAAKAQNVAADYVVVDSFDTLMSRLWRAIPNKPHLLNEKIQRAAAAEVRIPLPPPGVAGPIVRTNALLIRQLPKQCRSMSLKRAVDWAELKQIQRGAQQNLVVTKSETIHVWGRDQDVRTNFGRDLLKLETAAVPTDFSASENFPFKAFVEEALAIGLARGNPLLVRIKSRAAYLIVDRHSDDIAKLAPLRNAVQNVGGDLPGVMSPISEDHPAASKVSWSECLRISLDQRDGHTWLNLAPDVWIWPQHARDVSRTFLDRRKGGRYNKQHNVILDAWLRILLGDGDRSGDVVIKTFDGEHGVENPSFVLSRRTAFSRRIQG